MWATSDRELDDKTMPRPANLERIEGIATAQAVRAVMPHFDRDGTLAVIEGRILDAARKGRGSVDVINTLPAPDGNLTQHYIHDCRDQVSKALVRAGYDVTYHGGGLAAPASLTVKWAN